MNDWETIREECFASRRDSLIANLYLLLARKEKRGEWTGTSQWHLDRWAEIVRDRVLDYANG